jgi:hypothetical protein
MNNILFMHISTTGIHAFLQSAGWGLARLNWGNLLPAEYKKDADAAVPLSDFKASYTLQRTMITADTHVNRLYIHIFTIC